MNHDPSILVQKVTQFRIQDLAKGPNFFPIFCWHSKAELAKLSKQYWLGFRVHSNALPTQPTCHSLPVSDFQTLKKSCSIESTNDPSSVIFSFQHMSGWQSGIGICLVIHRFPLEATLFFADFKPPWCQLCTKMPEMSDFCYFGKTRMDGRGRQPQLICCKISARPKYDCWRIIKG